LIRKDNNELKIFYPSSVAVTEPFKGMAEYAISKGAGELICAHLVSLFPKLTIIIKRLPRILTDQTASLALVEANTAIDTMIPIVNEMN